LELIKNHLNNIFLQIKFVLKKNPKVKNILYLNFFQQVLLKLNLKDSNILEHKKLKKMTFPKYLKHIQKVKKYINLRENFLYLDYMFLILKVFLYHLLVNNNQLFNLKLQLELNISLQDMNFKNSKL